LVTAFGEYIILVFFRPLRPTLPGQLSVSTGDDFGLYWRRNGELCVAVGPVTRTAGIYWVIVCQRSGSDTGRLKGKMGCFFFFIIRFAGIPINMRYAGIQARIVCRAPQLFGSTSTIDRFGESFRDGKYSSVSCLLAVLLLTVPHPCPAIC